jgi:hypothetical protein
VPRIVSGMACLAGLLLITYAKSLEGNAEHLGILAGLAITLIGAVASFRLLFRSSEGK